jgi:hypothetical protein
MGKWSTGPKHPNSIGVGLFLPCPAILPIAGSFWICFAARMIRKLPSGHYRLYSRKVDPKTKRRKNLGTFATRAAAEKHERAVQFFKRGG